MIKLFTSLFILLSISYTRAENIVLTEENTISFNQPFTGMFVSKKQLEIMKKSSNLPSNKPLFIVMNTPGGSVHAGLNFIDTVKSLNRKVHTITIFAASMGYQVVQELGTRYITPSGILMSHRGHLSGLSGQVPGELNSRLSHIESILNGMNVRAASRVKMSLESYKSAIINELWVSGEEAVDKKHADKLANVSCSKKLVEGVESVEFNTIFGPITVKMSKCPLISEPIEVAFGNIKNPAQREAIFKFLNKRRKRVNLTL